MTSGYGRGPAGSEPTGRGAPRRNPARIRPYLSTPRAEPRPAAGETGAATVGGTGTGGGETGAASGGERPRPFVLTSGRVDGVDPDICLETQVTANPTPPKPAANLAPELQAIIAICAQPVSVAEISARVPLHYGVTKVLVGDLRADGYLDVHTMDVANPHDPETILRVIRGLREIA